MCTTFGPRPTLWSHLLLYKGCVNTKWCSSSSSAPPRLITPLELMSCFVYWGHKRHLLLSSKVSLSHTHTYLHTQSDAHRNQCVTLIWIEGCKTQLLITLAWSLKTTHKWSRKNKKRRNEQMIQTSSRHSLNLPPVFYFHFLRAERLTAPSHAAHNTPRSSVSHP